MKIRSAALVASAVSLALASVPLQTDADPGNPPQKAKRQVDRTGVILGLAHVLVVALVLLDKKSERLASP